MSCKSVRPSWRYRTRNSARARAEGYDFSPAGQLTLDTHGKIVEANLRAATLVGIDREKLIGQPFIRFVAQDSQDIFHWHCQKVLKTGTRQSCEMQLQKKSGAPHWVHLESLAVDRESGPVTHWQTALLDISEQKRTEGALRLAKFSMERAADAVYWIDQQARILDVNEAASLMLGYSKDELCAMTVHDLNPDFQKQTVARVLGRNSAARDHGAGDGPSGEEWPADPHRGECQLSVLRRKGIPLRVRARHHRAEARRRKKCGVLKRSSRPWWRTSPTSIFVNGREGLKSSEVNKAGEDLMGALPRGLDRQDWRHYDLDVQREPRKRTFLTKKDRQVTREVRTPDLDIPDGADRDVRIKVCASSIPRRFPFVTTRVNLSICWASTKTSRIESRLRRRSGRVSG